MSAEAVHEFERLRRTDVDFAGGKGANLGELTAAAEQRLLLEHARGQRGDSR